ncbi:DUF3656 domain-containing protein [Collinsella sp. AGMB00827]|uniref:DUF3656 domain-containing protein n=1 Tax=Collinsella ureilytica TaxID=2869515 RepID=A0ABS7MIB5_9ACTN|nr:U32 family peptidase [Collinsella urealyticum]MBY4797100.1 DUF3656 domain-containing protein [Collinsella urealyticum]
MSLEFRASSAAHGISHARVPASSLPAPRARSEQRSSAPAAHSEQHPHAATPARTAPELLAPAGSPEAFRAALAAGADAVYCGMGAFNARRKAENFTDEAFAEACRAAHIAGARVYVTVNIVIKDTELIDAVELVRRCTILGADAFIIQDWGLFSAIRTLMPEIETHISTQANIHDARATLWCAAAGADRVTLSRELSIHEIAQIAKTDVELEVFAHGAICFSYSGICLLSSFVCTGRSANRGMCAQPCRLPYELIDESGASISAPRRDRALCPRDMNTSELLASLVEAGAGALKIEGRMKAPDYVHTVVGVYRYTLDDVLASREADAAERHDRARRLKRAFNRDFTSEYQKGRSGDEMMSYERSNNRGQVIGEVIACRTVGSGLAKKLRPEDRRNRVACATLRLFEPMGAGDLIELRHIDAFDRYLTFTAEQSACAGEDVEVRIPRAVPVGARVRVIRSREAIEAADEALRQTCVRRRLVSVKITARLAQPFSVALTCVDDPSLSVCASGAPVEPARTREVSADDLVEHVGRMGASSFEAASFEVELDSGCGLGFSAVHKVRARACDLLEELILAPVVARAAAARALPPFELDMLEEHVAVRSTVVIADERNADSSVAKGDAGQRDADLLATQCVAGTRDANSLTARGEVLVFADRGDALVSADRGDGAQLDALVSAPRHELELAALAPDLTFAQIARTAGGNRIYLSSDALEEAGLNPADAAEQGFIPVLDEVCREKDRERLDRWVIAGAPVAVGNVSELAFAYERGAQAEICPCIPVHNRAAAQFLARSGAEALWLTSELTLHEIEHFVPHVPLQTGIMILGRPRVMTSEHCMLMVADACIHNCARCTLRRRSLSLKNIDGRLLPVRTDIHGRSRLYEDALIDLTPQMSALAAAGVFRFMVDGTVMDAEEFESSLAHAKRALTAVREGRTPAQRMPGSSSGCLFAGIE